MKKIFVMLGIILFFTGTALSITFNMWSWINLSDFEESQKYCTSRYGFMITEGKRVENGIVQFHLTCCCNEGLTFDPIKEDCVPQKDQY